MEIERHREFNLRASNFESLMGSALSRKQSRSAMVVFKPGNNINKSKTLEKKKA